VQSIIHKHGRRYVKFAIVGLIGVGVNFVVYAGLGRSDPAWLAGILAGSVSNYGLNVLVGVIKDA
jgi:putative flippase GtrA